MSWCIHHLCAVFLCNICSIVLMVHMCVIVSWRILLYRDIHLPSCLLTYTLCPFWGLAANSSVWSPLYWAMLSGCIKVWPAFMLVSASRSVCQVFFGRPLSTCLASCFSELVWWCWQRACEVYVVWLVMCHCVRSYGITMFVSWHVTCIWQDLDEEDDLPSHPKPHVARRLLEPDARSIDSDDYQEFESYQSQQMKGGSGKDHPTPATTAAVTCQSFQLFLH